MGAMWGTKISSEREFFGLAAFGADEAGTVLAGVFFVGGGDDVEAGQGAAAGVAGEMRWVDGGAMKASPELRALTESLGALAKVITDIINQRLSEELTSRRWEIERTIAPVAPEERWVGKKEVAAHCGASLRTISSWMRQGRIPYVRLGGRKVRFKLSAVDAAVERWERGGGRW
jgi:excisionase family DNA binding protein